MLVIRDAQMKAFGQASRNRFEAELTRFFLERYPRECRQAGGTAQIGLLVAQGVTAAQAHGCSTQRQVRLYVTLMVILGSGFADDPQLPWVRAGLDKDAIPDPTQRMDALFESALAYLGEVAGRKGEIMVRALLRIRSFDLAAVPDSQGDAWIRDVAGILNRFHPEKYAHQGEFATLALIREGIARAGGYGLKNGAEDRTGVFVYTALMFMLGSGFDMDPLHPWAGAVLKDASLSRGASRGKALYTRAMDHLEQSLGAG